MTYEEIKAEIEFLNWEIENTNDHDEIHELTLKRDRLFEDINAEMDMA